MFSVCSACNCMVMLIKCLLYKRSVAKCLNNGKNKYKYTATFGQLAIWTLIIIGIVENL